MIQFYASILLMVSVLLLSFGPWLHVFQRGLYTKAPDEQVDKAIDCNQLLSSCLEWIGWILVLIAVINEYMKIDQRDRIADVFCVIRIALESWGCILGSMVVFTDLLLCMTVTNWNTEKSLRTWAMDAFYESIQQGIWKKYELEPDAEWGPMIDGENT